MNKTIRRLHARFKRELNKIGIGISVRQLVQISQGENGKAILIVGPGSISIPSLGWGAVETIISETLDIYVQEGYEVWLINSKHYSDWNKVKSKHFDVILSHSDYHTIKLSKLWTSTPKIIVSHYGLAGYPERWHKSFSKIVNSYSEFSKIVCLSPRVFETFSNLFASEKLLMSPNGSSFDPIIHTNSNSIYLCIGKIEERKMQYELFLKLKQSAEKIHFMGPIADERVSKLIGSDDEAAKSFLGSLNRDELKASISLYKALILFSKGEGDALVLYEAQLAGLPILLTEEALGAQNANLPWVKVISEHSSADEIEISYRSLEKNRKIISTYAKENYNWQKRNLNLTNLIRDLAGL
jgi:hypothetical protein